MHLLKSIYVLDIHTLFIALSAISKRRKVQKKATDFFLSHMYNGLLPSGFQTLGMAPLVKKRRSRRNSVLKAEKTTATAVLLLTDNLMTISIFSFPLSIASCGVKPGVIQTQHNTT